MHRAPNSNRLISLAAAIVAVIAALGTLLAHHRSVSALAAKNEAILAQGRAFDAYSAYEAKQTRIAAYQALIAGDVAPNATARTRLESLARAEQASSVPLSSKGNSLELQAQRADARAEGLFKSYETLQAATTMFEIAIVLVSIATLTGTRYFFPGGCELGAVGAVLFTLGLIQGR